MPDEGSGPSYTAPFVVVNEDFSMKMQYVRPHQITSLTRCFGKAEVELAAGRLLEYFRLRSIWCSFTIEQLQNFYKEKGFEPGGMFFGLIGGWYDDGGFGGAWREPGEIYLACDKSGNYCVTDKFIARCSQNLKRAA